MGGYFIVLAVLSDSLARVIEEYPRLFISQGGRCLQMSKVRRTGPLSPGLSTSQPLGRGFRCLEGIYATYRTLLFLRVIDLWKTSHLFLGQVQGC
jgi:hypothetical protein